ncbi:MAG: DUF427 domain-containing protein [Anaerolineae bacterium]|nr:DUF427 domain-containing protein [Anaerolineae bacterium]
MFRGFKRQEPEPGQESVWDYPRPPRVEKTDKRLRVVFNGVVIADTHNAYRVLETSHPPTYYFPRDDVKMEYFDPTSRSTICEFKGVASYWQITVGDKTEVNAAWSYSRPHKDFEVIRDAICFYPSKMDACYVGDEQARAQDGDFYGGWITSNIVGPFKGGPGTMLW